MKLDYMARPSDLLLTQQMRDLVWRRTVPFLDRGGMTRSLEHLLAEAYLQGVRDARAALEPELSA